MRKGTKIVSVLVIPVVTIILFLALGFGVLQSKDSVFAQSASLTIISLTSENKLVGNGQFIISPNPFTGSGNYTVSDNSADDTEKDKDGVITISGIKNGNYNIIQTKTQNGFSVDQIQKNVQINNSADVVTFTDLSSSNGISSSGRSVTYTTKFECGSIHAGEGPLRPGHYDTDISLYNKQKTETQLFWNSVLNNEPATNAILIKMSPETSKSITCKDIRMALDSTESFVEGFMVISVPLDSSLNSGSTMITNNSDYNVLDVQVFYTANALDMLPHEVIVDKISFYIIQDGTGKIPQNMMKKTLDVSIPSTLEEVVDTEMKVKKSIQKQYNLTDDDLEKISVRIKSISVGVGVLIDDHAISLSTVKPQLAS